MDRLKGACTRSQTSSLILLTSILQLTEARRAAIVNATKRTAAAEETAKKLQHILKEKTQMEKDLQKQLELSKQRMQLTKDLIVTLQKLGEGKAKLESASKKAETLEARIERLRSETDDFESRYQVNAPQFQKAMPAEAGDTERKKAV
ncbi:hypothetical protein JR316_0008099 [Psilocybe cubensis]|uniref:Uncharacterized protein n=2 Tax=Psilocybe cubensis TaxID=181762 RepID=A0A8H7XV11_PSICU|nr:hypothetical protein JR316_0008099 [Psilocybe cubensis]KAH9479505.1 hypothetical protein JR316_0008099 [Psilocybe cubensis]